MKMLEAAIFYLEKMNFSVIPVGQNKKALVKWVDYQTRKPTKDEINEWWTKWPEANIGIVTGEVSGVDVVDCDSLNGKNTLNEFLPDTFTTPVSKTPKGWHFFFKTRPGLSNGVRIIRDCDLRTTGGYVIAPPSKNGSGVGYEWLPDLKIKDVAFSDMPDMLFDILQQGSSCQGELSSEHIYNTNILKGGVVGGGTVRDDILACNKAVTKSNNCNISFEKGGRDNTLFHLANHLVKSEMPLINIEQYLVFFGRHCNPPFPESEIKLKIKSALDRVKKRSFSVMDDLRELISVTSGNISVTDLYQAVTSVTRSEKAAVRMAVKRFVNEKLLEKTGNRAGEYRIVDRTCSPEDWKNSNIENIKLWLPFELDTMIEIPAGSIILFAGAQDAGKSAIMMNIAKENMEKWNTHYFSSELSAASFKNRLSKFDNMQVEDWNINFYSRGSNFADVIKCGKNDLNIIDYLEIHDQFYKVSGYLDDIYKKMDRKGVTVVAIQKDPYKEFGRGGSFIEEKPVLSISLDRGGIAKINKFKGEWWGENPRGKQYKFKIINGSRLKMVHHWHEPAPK